jgi:DNA-directed RNA polymerase subunit RPC12/RpoP
MKYSTATRVTKTLVICSVVFCAVGLFLGASNAPLRLTLTAAALLMLSAALIVTIVFCKCPYCGKRIFFGAATVVYCPNCHRNLETGKKVSPKKARTTRRQ